MRRNQNFFADGPAQGASGSEQGGHLDNGLNGLFGPRLVAGRHQSLGPGGP